MNQTQSIAVAITGASGVQYGIKLIEQLLLREIHIHLMISDAAKVVFSTEADINIPVHAGAIVDLLREQTGVKNNGNISFYSKNDWMSIVASGSSCPDKMVICPCSTGTLSAVAHGHSDNLIERAADVMIKEKKTLIMLLREMPFSAIHLQNMLKLAELGVTIMPASPGFYQQPETIDDLINFVVARILNHLGFEQNISNAWGYQN